MPKIIVTGANGQLGKEFALINNTDVAVIPLTKNECNICNFDELKKNIKKIKPDYLVNCAAYTQVDNCENNRKIANLINNSAVKNLAQLSNELNFTLVHVSTDYVFDGNFNKPISENADTNPLNYYGITKLAGERSLQETAKKFYIIRVGWLYGEYGTNFPTVILRNLKSKKKLSVVNDQFGSPTPARLVKDCILNLINVNKRLYGIYNIAPNNICSWFDVAKFIAKEKELDSSNILPISSSNLERDALRPSYSFLDNEKFSKKFNYEFFSWQHYLKDYLKISNGAK